MRVAVSSGEACGVGEVREGEAEGGRKGGRRSDRTRGEY